MERSIFPRAYRFAEPVVLGCEGTQEPVTVFTPGIVGFVEKEMA